MFAGTTQAFLASGLVCWYPCYLGMCCVDVGYVRFSVSSNASVGGFHSIDVASRGRGDFVPVQTCSLPENYLNREYISIENKFRNFFQILNFAVFEPIPIPPPPSLEYGG